MLLMLSLLPSSSCPRVVKSSSSSSSSRLYVVANDANDEDDKTLTPVSSHYSLLQHQSAAARRRLSRVAKRVKQRETLSSPSLALSRAKSRRERDEMEKMPEGGEDSMSQCQSLSLSLSGIMRYAARARAVRVFQCACCDSPSLRVIARTDEWANGMET